METSPSAIKIYRTSKGQDVPIDKLPDTYLVNIIRKFERQEPNHELLPDLLSELAKRPQAAKDWYQQRVEAGK